MNEERYYTHPTAIIDEGAIIGEHTKVWHFCHIMDGATIGEKCSLGQNVVVHSSAKIGNCVKIQNNVSVYDGVVLEDYVFCGPSMVFTNVNNPRSEVNRQNEYQTTLVKKGATIGANATIRCGATIGSYAFIGAGAVVLKDVLNHALIVGNPGIQKGWMCKCGIRLQPVKSKLTCSECSTSYQITDQGLESIE